MIRHQIAQTNQEKTRHWINLSLHEMPPNQVNPKDALAMYGVRMRMPDAPMLRIFLLKSEKKNIKLKL